MNIVANPTQQIAATKKDYVKKITIQLAKTLAGFIEIGRLLAEAETKLGRKQWLGMVNTELPFSRRTAEKLVKISEDQRLTDPKYAAHLPPHWTSLHELTYLDDEAFERGINEGIIHPDAERKEIKALKERNKPRSASNRSPSGEKFSTKSSKSLESDEDSDVTSAAWAHYNDRTPLEYRQYPPEFLSNPIKSFNNSREKREQFRKEIRKTCQIYKLNIDENELLRLVIIQYLERRIMTMKEEIEHNKKDNPVEQLEDAFFQLATGRKLTKLPNKGFRETDLRHPNNDYGDFDYQQLEGYCIDMQLCTKYTPLEMINPDGYADLMAWSFLTGDADQRDRARAALEIIIDKSNTAKYHLEMLDE